MVWGAGIGVGGEASLDHRGRHSRPLTKASREEIGVDVIKRV